MIREAVSDRDLAAYAAVWRSASPRDAVSVEFVAERLAREPERLYLLAEEGGNPVACAVTSPTSHPERRHVGVGVVPGHRRRGLGSVLLRRCLEHARSLGAEEATSYVWEDCEPGLAFSRRHGFVRFERTVELELELGGEVAPPPPAGIEIVELAPEHLPGAYEIWIEGVADIPSEETPPPLPYEEWLRHTRAKELVLVALDEAQVVGFAALEDRDREAGVAGNDLTTVRRSHRRRGIAEALKRTQLARAYERGYRTVVTGQDEANVGMRRLNEKLGYRPLPATVGVRRPLVTA